MIALDTNILLRYVLQDHQRQSALATKLVEAELTEAAPGFVSLVVICEFVCALNRSYGMPRPRIMAFLELLADTSQLVVEDAEAIAALDRKSDIADAIIHHISRKHGCLRTLTFDRKFARLEGVELLA